MTRDEPGNVETLKVLGKELLSRGKSVAGKVVVAAKDYGSQGVAATKEYTTEKYGEVKENVRQRGVRNSLLSQLKQDPGTTGLMKRYWVDDQHYIVFNPGAQGQVVAAGVMLEDYISTGMANGRAGEVCRVITASKAEINSRHGAYQQRDDIRLAQQQNIRNAQSHAWGGAPKGPSAPRVGGGARKAPTQGYVPVQRRGVMTDAEIFGTPAPTKQGPLPGAYRAPTDSDLFGSPAPRRGPAGPAPGAGRMKTDAEIFGTAAATRRTKAKKPAKKEAAKKTKKTTKKTTKKITTQRKGRGN